jgi:ribosome-associated protein
MPPRPELYVSVSLGIPRSELIVRATRAGGAGGQHVNTSSTRVEVSWNVRTSRVLSDVQRTRLLSALAARLSEEGVLRVVASERRSQTQNREAGEERLATVVRRALSVPKRRRPTSPTRGSVERRLEEKHRRAKLKKDRRGEIE